MSADVSAGGDGRSHRSCDSLRPRCGCQAVRYAPRGARRGLSTCQTPKRIRFMTILHLQASPVFGRSGCGRLGRVGCASNELRRSSSAVTSGCVARLSRSFGSGLRSPNTHLQRTTMTARASIPTLRYSGTDRRRTAVSRQSGKLSELFHQSDGSPSAPFGGFSHYSLSRPIASL